MGGKEEPLKQEIGALLEECKTIREDNLKNVEAGRQVLIHTLVFSGALFVGSPFIME